MLSIRWGGLGFSRMFVSALLAASLVVSRALAPVSLAPGEPAGIQRAQGERRDIVLFSAIGLVTATGLGILLVGHHDNMASSTSAP